jgi:hypothetical protein
MRLRRVLLDSVGHADARFDPLLLDFRGESGQALDTVLWLRNGGGKTSLLSLLFSVLQPHRNWFLGSLQKERGRTIDKYVLADDVAHVVLEWEDEGLPGFGPPFVTAVVATRRPEGGDERVARFFYAFKPTDGVLTVDDLPIREGGRRTPYKRYRQLLEELAGRHASTELVVRDHQGEWQDYLVTNQLDPEVFRYQLTMNSAEGGAGKLLERFSDADTFIDFLVDVVSDPTDAAEVSQNLAQVADKIEMRPRRQREREFVAGVVQRLRPLAEASRACEDARQRHDGLRLEGLALRRRIAQAASAAEQRAADREAEAERQKEVAGEAERHRSLYDRQANALQVQAKRFEIEELKSATATAGELVDEAKRVARAWQASEAVVELRVVEQRSEALRAALAREVEDAEELRHDYESAAMRLRRRLEALAADARAAAERAETSAKASEASRAGAAHREIAAGNRVAEIGIELEHLIKSRADLDRQVGALARDGVLERGETATAALVRLRGADLLAQRRLEAIPNEREVIEKARETASADARDLGRRIADLERQHEQRRRERDELQARALQLGEDGRVVELMGHGPVDVLLAGNALAERLIDAVAAAERRLVEIQVAALEDRRALVAIERTGLLPAAVSVEQAVALLQEAKLAATTGWQHLAQNVRRDDWPRLLARSPDLLDAVVVHPERLERAAEVLGSAAFPSLAGSLTVVESSEFTRELGEDRRLWTLPANQARYDAAAAAGERDRREAEVAAADRRLEEDVAGRDADQALLLRLRQLRDDCPPGHLEWLLAELEGETQRLAKLADRLQVQEDAVAAAKRDLNELLAEERRLHAERHRLTALIGRLAPVAAQEEQRDAWLLLQGELESERAQRLEEQEAARLARAEAQTAVDRSVGEALQSRHDARSWMAEVGRLPHFDVEAETPVAAMLEALRAEHEMLRDQYEGRTSRSQTALDAQAAAERAGEVRAKLDQFGDIVVRARELLATPGAESVGFRAERLDRAQREQDEATRAHGRAETELRRAEMELEQLTRESRNLTTLPPELRPGDRAHAERLLADVSGRRDEVRARRDEADLARRDAADAARDAAHEHELLRSEERHLLQTLGQQEVELQATYEPITATAAKQQATAVVGALQEAARGVTDLESKMRHAATLMRQFAGRSEYDELEGPYRERLTDPDDRALAGRAESDLIQFELRLPFLDHQLAEIERHQNLVAEQLLALANRALDNLRWLQRQEMPEGLGQWSGQHYFHIRYDLPETHDERLARIRLLLEEAVVVKPPPRGMRLVQQALRRVNRRPHFEVTVLKPNEGLRLERADVAEIGAWSGGQKLTTAILIYCALARLRADNRSQRRASPVGVLLLDNPIGTANLVTLIDLQRLVAERFGVQLIYTTGIDDKPALAPFTNMIRLGNRLERRRERGHIVVEDDEVAVVEAARIYRRDRR